MRSGLGWLVALGLAGSAMAATPTVGVILPRGLQRGTEREVSFNGARLTDAAQVLFYSSGLSVVDLKVVNDNQVKVKLKAAPDCALGEHVVRLVAKSGMSELRTVYVGPYPQVEEKEPNSEFAKPQPIQTGRTVEGRVDNEDVDYFSLTAKKGERLAIEIEGMRLGVTIFDPCISILNSKRFTLATSDDNILMNQDGACSIVAPEDGTYVIEVRETSYRGDGNCHYRLHVGSHPRPAAVYPLGGKVGESVNFQFLGDPRGDFQQAVVLPKVAKTKFPIFPQQADGVAPSGNSVRVSEFANVLEVEPNDEVGKASKGDMALPAAFNGVISKNGDVDFFRFKATQGQVFDVTCFARQLRSPLDPVIHLHYGDGRYIAGNDDAIGPDSYLRFQAPATGEFALQVHDHLRKGGPDYVYRVEFKPVKARVSVTVPEFQQFTQDRRHVTVARGNRMVTLISATRNDWGGEVKIEAQDLPPGVAVSGENMSPNTTLVPLLFEAKADAAIGTAKLANILASHPDPKQNIRGGFEQDVPLSYGEPNTTPYWRVQPDRLAVSVAEELPFSVRIVEPKVPLVQDGSMNVKVVVDRKPGFKAAVNIYNIFNPPGISSAPSVTIPADKNEIDYPFNANRGAELRSWKMAFQAMADVGKGPMWCATQLATLKIAAPYSEMALQMATAEQAKNAEVVCKVDPKTAYQGKAKVTLVGLPAHVVCPPVEIAKDAKEIVFKLTVGKDAPAGQHKSLFCQMIVTENGEAIVHNLGQTGTLRIDPPPPPKKNEPAKPAVAAAPAAAAAPAKAEPKRLTRLEMLRLDAEKNKQNKQ